MEQQTGGPVHTPTTAGRPQPTPQPVPEPVRQPEPDSTWGTIKFEGETYEVMHPKEWPAKCLRWLRDNDYVSVLEVVIGVEQYQRFEDTHKLGDVERLITAIEEQLGGNF